MRMSVVPLDYDVIEPGVIKFRNPELHAKAMDFCRRELATGELDVTKLAKVWVAVAEDEVIGITGFCMKPDIPVFRVAGENAVRATKILTDRLLSFFADQGLTGVEVFVHLSSKERPEQRCERWEESLKAVDAKPADRFSVTVR